VQPLTHTAGVALDALPLPAFQADEVEQRLDSRLLCTRRYGVELGEVAQVVESGEAFVEAALAAEAETLDPQQGPPGEGE
jgi:hypothetical protein